MSNKDISEKTAKCLPKLNHGELVNSGFWVGHMLMVVATIFGVYLAAQQGLEQAIRYDQYNDTQNNYYLRRSLYDEVSDNVKIMRDFDAEYLSKSASSEALTINRPVIGTYVWEAMKFSAATLQTPSAYLSAIRRFYRNSESIIDRALARNLGASYASKLLRVELNKMEQDVLPKLAKNYQLLGRELSQDFNVEESRDGTH